MPRRRLGVQRDTIQRLGYRIVQFAGQPIAFFGDGLLPLALTQGFFGLGALGDLPPQFRGTLFDLYLELPSARLQAPDPQAAGR